MGDTRIGTRDAETVLTSLYNGAPDTQWGDLAAFWIDEKP
jgi:hypothetical protein